MTPERVTVTIRSSAGEAAPLTVQDAMHQILDFFDLLSAAGGEEGKVVSWRLVEVSMASPLSATAEPFSDVPGVQPDVIAHQEKERVLSSIREITEAGQIPAWMDAASRTLARSLFNRTLNGIGRTDIKFDNQKSVATIVERTAKLAIAALDAADRRHEVEEDLSRSEIGSLEGNIIRLETYHGQPAIRLLERITNRDIPCVLSLSLAEQIGPQHNWAEVWTGRRVLVVGEILFRPTGQIGRVCADAIHPIDARQLAYADISDRNFTNGLPVQKYLSQLWEDESG